MDTTDAEQRCGGCKGWRFVGGPHEMLQRAKRRRHQAVSGRPYALAIRSADPRTHPGSFPGTRPPGEAVSAMGKKRRGKKPKKRWVRKRPDDVFVRGPIRIERYGRFVRMVNMSTPEQHAANLEALAAENTQILADLRRELATLQDLIGSYDGLELMHRAAYMLLPLLVKYRSENEYPSEDTLVLPTVEYIQYLIARTQPIAGGATPSEQQWDEVWERALAVMRLTQNHLIARGTITQPPTAIDDLRFILDSRRLGGRVERYPQFQSDHLRSALGPYRSHITDIHGLQVEDVISGIDQIQDYLRSGVLGRYQTLAEVSATLMQRLATSGHDPSPEAPPAEVARIHATLATPAFADEYARSQEAARMALTPAIFDITDVSLLPKSFLSLLSVRPGESILTTLTGPGHDDLSPLSRSVLHRKPLLEINGRFYSFYHTGLDDHVAAIIEDDLIARRPAALGDMMRKRGEQLESDTRQVLVDLLRPDLILQNVYYPNPDDPANLTELDILLAVDDVLLLVEAKAGGMDAAASRGAPESLAQALSDLIIEGQRQSERAEKYLRSADEVPLFDKDGRTELHRLSHSRFRKIFRVVVTREALGWVGAQIAILAVLDPTLSKAYPWHVSVDDLRVIAHLFRNDEIRFIHYLEVRLPAAAASALSQADELEHVGLYNKMNVYHELPVRDVDRMRFDASYMRDIDYYFMDRAAGIETPLPTQSMPAAVRRLLEGMTLSGVPGRFEAGSILLGLNSEARARLADAVETLEQGLSQGRRRSFRMGVDECGLTVSYAEHASWDEEIRRSAVQMEHSGARRWLAVRLGQGVPGEVRSIEVITPGRFTPGELAGAHAAHARRTKETIMRERPGRNDPCPCGSRRKFKKCHGA